MSKTETPKQYRQGDVFLVKVAELPKTAEPQKKTENRVVLEYGEVTGHAHAIAADEATIYIDAARRYLEVCYNATLKHEEHAPIELEAGVYEIVRQRQYAPEEITYVLD